MRPRAREKRSVSFASSSSSRNGGGFRRRSRRELRASRVRKASRPAAAVERLDAFRHGLQPSPPLARGELEGRAELVDDAVDVPRVHEQRSREHLGGACELRQEQRAAPAAGQAGLGLAEDVLMRDEVHPVAQRGHHHHVRPPVERDEARLRDVAMQVLDGRDARLPEAAVDARDQELDLVALRPVLRALEAGRDEHLEHRRRARTRRVSLEEALVRDQLLRDPLRVVEPLDAEDESPPLVLLLELRVQPRRLGVCERRAKALDVDADRIDADSDVARRDVEPVRARVEPEHPEARRPEVPGVVADLEARRSRSRARRAAGSRAREGADRPRTTGTACAGRTRPRGPGARRRSIAGTSMRWKSWTHTLVSGPQRSMIASAKRSLTST